MLRLPRTSTYSHSESTSGQVSTTYSHTYGCRPYKLLATVAAQHICSSASCSAVWELQARQCRRITWLTPLAGWTCAE
eukprot:scaffold8008_cov430-Prasinococcus_capsulatus_cf.AAC.4